MRYLVILEIVLILSNTPSAMIGWTSCVRHPEFQIMLKFSVLIKDSLMTGVGEDSV